MPMLARVENNEIQVSGWTVTGIVALLGLVAPIVTAVSGGIVSQKQQQSSVMLESVKLDQERRKVSVDLYQKALAYPDAKQRELSVRFLIAAGLVEDRENKLAALKPGDIPHWPVASGAKADSKVPPSTPR
jgi:hypothetical protein